MATHTLVSPTTLTSTKLVSLALHGKTLLSTLTETHTSDVTIVSTTIMPIVPTIVTQMSPQSVIVSTQQQPTVVNVAPAVTTQLTLHLTGDSGDVTELVTDIIIPATVLNTRRARREIRPHSIESSNVPSSYIASTSVVGGGDGNGEGVGGDGDGLGYNIFSHSRSVNTVLHDTHLGTEPLPSEINGSFSTESSSSSFSTSHSSLTPSHQPQMWVFYVFDHNNLC